MPLLEKHSEKELAFLSSRISVTRNLFRKIEYMKRHALVDANSKAVDQDIDEMNVGLDEF